MNPALVGILIYLSIQGALGIWALVLMYLERRDARGQHRH